MGAADGEERDRADMGVDPPRLDRGEHEARRLLLGLLLRAFSAEYYSVVFSAQTAHDQTVNTLQHQADDLSHLGPAFDLLSQSERELSLPFTRMAKELDALRELFLKQVHDEHVSGLSSLLSFNAGMASSLKENKFLTFELCPGRETGDVVS